MIFPSLGRDRRGRIDNEDASQNDRILRNALVCPEDAGAGADGGAYRSGERFDRRICAEREGYSHQ